MRQVLARLKSKFAKNKEQISKLEARISTTEPGILEVKLIHGKKRFVGSSGNLLVK
jgi:hypothetical protein